MLRMEVLGPVRAWVGDRPVDLGGPRRRDVLAILLVHRGAAVSLDRLADALWGDRLPPTALQTLRAHVAHLRTALEDAHVIVTVSRGYQLAADVETDADGFERDAAKARAHDGDGDLPAAWALYGRALQGWRGSPYADVDLDLVELSAERQRLNALREEAQRDQVAVGLQLGYQRDLLPQIRALVAERPYDEALVRYLASALYADGRQVEALSTLERLRAALRDELGLEPTPETRALEVAILRQEGPQGGVAGGNVRLVDVPAPVAPTVGRTAETAQISDDLALHRIVTLVGPGGVGKTHLAMEAGRAAADAFRDGAAFVSFAEVRDPGSLVEHLASALGMAAQVSRSTRHGISQFLRGRELLLVLDNCEHLLDPISDLVEWLVGLDPAVRILATSRERLGLPGEVVVAVEPLPVGDAPGQGEAIDLFIQSARRRVASFAATASDLAVIAEICRRIDGLPLALELAAGRCATTSLGEVLDLLEDPVAALSRGLRTADPRHRSLDATIRWSYDQLDDTQRTLLRAVSVFAGSFDRSAAATVSSALGAADAGTQLEDLVERSLVTGTPTPRGTRYRMLDTIRAFARRELRQHEETAAASTAHLEHHLRLARSGQYGVLTDMAWFERLEDALPDLRAAYHHAIAAGDVSAALRLASALTVFMTCRHFNEGASWLQAALEAAEGFDGVPPHVASAAMVARGSYLCLRGELQLGRAAFAQGMAYHRQAVSGDARSDIALLWALNWLSFHPPPDDPHQAYVEATEGLEIAQRTGDPVAVFYLSLRVAESVLVEATHSRGRVTTDELREIERGARDALAFAARHLGPSFDGFGKSIAEAVLGIVQSLDGSVDEGLARAESAVLRLHGKGLGAVAAGRLISLGQLALGFGRHRRARELITLGLQWIAATGFSYPTRSGLASVAALIAADDPAAAAMLLGAAEGRPADLHSNYAFIDEDTLMRGIRERLSPVEWHDAHTRGARLHQGEAVATALSCLGTPPTGSVPTASTGVAELAPQP